MAGAGMGDGTWVGLDAHARSVVAGLISEDTGELRVCRAPHRTPEPVRWVGELDAPVRVADEAGHPVPFHRRPPARRSARPGLSSLEMGEAPEAVVGGQLRRRRIPVGLLARKPSRDPDAPESAAYLPSYAGGGSVGGATKPARRPR